jgi:hypothetical protein
MNKYIVGYIVSSTYGELHVEAHTKEQAKEIARIQIRWGLKKHGKLEIMNVRNEGQPKPKY